MSGSGSPSVGRRRKKVVINYGRSSDAFLGWSGRVYKIHIDNLRPGLGGFLVSLLVNFRFKSDHDRSQRTDRTSTKSKLFRFRV